MEEHATGLADEDQKSCFTPGSPLASSTTSFHLQLHLKPRRASSARPTAPYFLYPFDHSPAAEIGSDAWLSVYLADFDLWNWCSVSSIADLEARIFHLWIDSGTAWI